MSRTPAQTHAIAVARAQRRRGQFAAEVSPGAPIDVTLDHETPGSVEVDYTLLVRTHRRHRRA